MFIFNKIDKAFTLAEVLVTLFVIGVVAALTIPLIVQNVQNTEFKVAFKKNYSVLSQVFGVIINDNGSTARGLFNNTDDMANKFLNYMSTIKQCPNGKTFNNCWGSSTITFLNGTTSTYNSNKAGGILNSGSYIMFMLYDTNCNNTSYTAQPICGVAYFDVNGKQPPNILGKDAFYVYVSATRLYPGGAWGTSVNLQEDTTTYGGGMAAQYIKDY